MQALLFVQKTVDLWLKNELSSAKREDFESYRKKSSPVKQIEKISNEVCNKWKRGKRKTGAEIAAKISEHQEVIEFFVEYALDQCMLKIESPQREAREEIMC